MKRLQSLSVLRYYSGASQETVKRHYARWRKERGIPLRCDSEECPLHDAPVWKGKPITLILDHRNGVKADNRPEELIVIHSYPQKDKGRVVVRHDSYVRTSREGKKEINFFPSPGIFKLTGEPRYPDCDSRFWRERAAMTLDQARAESPPPRAIGKRFKSTRRLPTK